MHHLNGKALIFHPIYSSNACVGGVMSTISLHIESPSYNFELFFLIFTDTNLLYLLRFYFVPVYFLHSMLARQTPLHSENVDY